MERLNHERDHIRQRRKYNKTFEQKVTKVTKNARACDASAVFSDWPLATSKLAPRVGMISQWLRLSPRHPQGVTIMLVVIQGHSTPDQIDTGCRNDPTDRPDAAPDAQRHPARRSDGRGYRGGSIPAGAKVLPGVFELIRVSSRTTGQPARSSRNTIVRLPQARSAIVTSRSSPGRARSRTKRRYSDRRLDLAQESTSFAQAHQPHQPLSLSRDCRLEGLEILRPRRRRPASPSSPS